MRAWHFVGETLRDGRPVPADGELLRHDGPCVMCESGLHASKRLIDALQYAPGNVICRVECGDIVEHATDKFVCRERTIIWRVDGAELLYRFARNCALDVIHLWEAPEVLQEYVKIGAAAGAAARTCPTMPRHTPPHPAIACWAAAGAAARSAASAAGAAAWEWAAAEAAARGAQNRRLTAMAMAAHRKTRRHTL